MLERLQRAVAEQPEAGFLHLRVRLERGARRGDRGRRGRVERVAVDAGRDRGKRDARAVVLGGQFDRALIAGGEQLTLAAVAAAPHGADGVDDMADWQPAGASDLRVAGVTAAEAATFLEQPGSRGAVDRAVDPAAAEQALVRRVDDRVRLGVGRDVAAVQRDESHGP